MIIVLMGVAGSGKTTVGRALAARLGCAFFDADDFHPAENIARMHAGVPLTDADREPWLASLCALVERVDAAGEDVVLACSALRARFRARLRAAANDLRYVYLRADRNVIARRLGARAGHFMSADLLGSQFAALEEPDDALVLDASRTPAELAAEIERSLASRPAIQSHRP
jgi:gluconokinase